MQTPARHRLPALCLPLLAATVAAQPYRYVDENGVTVYSQTPPPGQQATQVPVAPAPPPGEYEAARQRLKTQLEAELDEQTGSDQAVKEKAVADQAAAERAQACAAARANRRTIEDLGARMLARPDGTLGRVGDEERVRLIEEADAQIKEYCD